MPIRCGNTTKSGKLLFRFPKGPGRAAAVGPLRAGPPANWYRGSDSSVICSEHFAPACFDVSSVIQKNLPFSERLRPVAGAASILHSVSSLLKPTGKKEGDSGRPGKGGKPQAVRQPQATPGPASCTLIWPTKRAFGFTDKGPPKESPEGLARTTVYGWAPPLSVILGKSPHHQGFC